jgi:hypothetical protein
MIHSIRLTQIRQAELQDQTDQTDQAARLGSLPVLDAENEKPVAWNHNLLFRVAEILIVAGRWLKSGHQLSC